MANERKNMSEWAIRNVACRMWDGGFMMYDSCTKQNKTCQCYSGIYTPQMCKGAKCHKDLVGGCSVVSR